LKTTESVSFKSYGISQFQELRNQSVSRVTESVSFKSCVVSEVLMDET